MHSLIDSIALSSPPWEALIAQLAEPTPEFWQEPAPCSGVELDAQLPQLVVLNGVESRGASPRSFAAFQRWQRSKYAQLIDIMAVRALAAALSEIGGTPIKLRNAQQDVTVAFYVAPKATYFPKLLYAANLALARHPPLLHSLLCGLIMFAIHPLADGNGRGARMYWIRGLHAAGYSPAEIETALHAFYGDSRIASIICINCANTGGTSLPFVKRWQQILQVLGSPH